MVTSGQAAARSRGKPEPAGPAAVVVGGRFEVQLGAPLPELCGPTAQAFMAGELRKSPRKLAALVIDPRLPARHDVIGQLERRAPGGVLLPVFRGSALLPGGERLVLIIEHPPGARLAPPLGAAFGAFSVERLLAEVAVPMRRILEQFAIQKITHRAIRADNLFYGAGGAGSLVLGECYSAPPGYSQPSIYEPIPRALARASGRGLGGSSDDLFAFGVTLAVLLRGADPRNGRADDEFLDLRIAEGSYEALLGGIEPGARIVPLLRGLLEDDSATRWTPQELGRFLDLGVANAPLHHKLRRSSVPFQFQGKSYVAPVPLARALTQHWSAGVEVVQYDALYDWMGRGAVDPKRLAALKRPEKAVGGPRQGKTGSADGDLARVILALDPDGPIRLREFSAQADGLAPVFAEAVHAQPLARDAVQVLEAQLVEFWAGQQSAVPAGGVAEVLKKHSRLAAMAQRPGIGFGPERCAYELSQDFACQSPLLGSGAVFDGPALLRALDARAEAKGEMFDHHIAAFLGARIGDASDRVLAEIAAAGSDRAASVLARLRLFAAATRHDGDELARFCGQLVARMSAVIDSFHNRPFRRSLARALEEAARAGKLKGLLALADDQRLARSDREGFINARARYLAATRALDALAKAIEARTERAESLGHRVAAMVSGFGALAVAAAFLLVR